MSRGILTWTQRLGLGVRFLLPLATFALFFVLNVVSVPMPYHALVKIPFLLMALFYWSVHRPSIVPPIFAFILGVLLDLLLLSPIGTHALLFVGFTWLVRDQRKVLTGQSFIVVWIGFAVALSIVSFAEWIVMSLLGWSWMPIGSPIMQIVLGVFLYPVMSSFLHFIHRFLPRQNFEPVQKSFNL